MAEPIITIRNLRKVFRVRLKSGEGLRATLRSLFRAEHRLVTAVDDLSMTVRRGEIRGLIGPNGAGKSTAIKMMSGILHPTSGTVDAMGFTPWRQREEYVRRIGVLFGQKTQLFWDLAPMDTFLLHREMYRIPERRFRESVERFKALLGIEAVIQQPVRSLSLGERMKCELVCALLHEPEVVYLDEPTIGLDLLARESIRSYIRQIRAERGVTFILTTHDLAEIEALCENVTIINHGSIVYDGPVAALGSVVSRQRIIDVRLAHEIETRQLQAFLHWMSREGVSVVAATSRSVQIAVDLDRTLLKDEIYAIFDLMPVQDLAVENVAIEDVIRRVYGGGA